MKKLVFIMLLSIGCVTFAYAQTEKSDRKISDKHRFGLGITTNILAGEKDLNNFYVPLSYIARTDQNNVELTSTSFYSFYFEYQYQFARNWSLSSRLKFNHRSVSYQYHHYQGWMSVMDISLWDFEIPITVNYKLPISKNTY